MLSREQVKNYWELSERHMRSLVSSKKLTPIVNGKKYYFKPIDCLLELGLTKKAEAYLTYSDIELYRDIVKEKQINNKLILDRIVDAIDNNRTLSFADLLRGN